MAAGGKRKGAGRPKGAKSKATKEVLERLNELGCDPIAGLADIAMDSGAEQSLRFQAYKELAQYVAPKRKAVELSGDVALEHSEVLVKINGKSARD